MIPGLHRRPTNRNLHGGLWAIADQIVLSCVSLVASVLVGRWGGPAILGQYILGYSVAVILSLLLRALVIGPFGVFVFRSPEREKSLMRGAALLQAGALIAMTCGIGIVGFFVATLTAQDSSLEWTILTFLIAITGIMIREVARQTSFAELNFSEGFVFDIIACAIHLLGLMTMGWFAKAGLGSFFVVLGMPGWISGLLWVLVISSRCQWSFSQAFARWPATWRFGCWDALAQVCQALQIYSLPWILTLTGGFQAAGFYAAAWSIVQLISPVAQGAGNAMGPILSRAFADHGLNRLRRLTWNLTAVIGVVGLVYVGVISLLGEQILAVTYGAQYDGGSILVLLSIVAALSLTFMAMTKAILILEKPNWVFAIQAGVLSIIVVSATGLGIPHGLQGAIWGLLIAQAIGGLAKVYLTHRAWSSWSHTATNQQSLPAALEAFPQANSL